MSFTGTFTLEDSLLLDGYRQQYLGTGTRPAVAIVGSVFFAVATVFLIVFHYDWVLSLSAGGMCVVNIMTLPFFRKRGIRRSFEKYPPREHTVDLTPERVIIRDADTTSESTWSAIKQVWKTKDGYLFFHRHDAVWFFLPIRLFPDESATREMDALLAGSGVLVKER
jgi:hypothetical protein